ncbi:Type II secretory pathway, component PulK [Anaerohalosphaera lusitana]|uniref:Type II secretory pathway, component PulK n=1 Tax=Anaerohalosphaera lusitana TaxID=1936003 RepID=A0A1U9NNW6_9BACT|nr:type II secretion system protein GspK [Anaerohalosphaera lusitana]AQT69642.1 Type II secretory pathway, component PulK [Anaerohalosphaera lusitana]
MNRSALIKSNPRQKGAALILVLLVLVLASTAVYTIGSRMSTHRHREQYVIDYQNARYAADSAMKYALATVGEMDFELRQSEYATEFWDFSDLFQLNEEEYKQLQLYLAANPELMFDKSDIYKKGTKLNDLKKSGEFKTIDEFFERADYDNPAVDPNTVTVPGPYGPEWPYVTDPMEIEIGDATVKIEIEDENAKMPIMWPTIKDEEYRRQAKDSFDIFCGYMGLSWEDVDLLEKQLDTVAEYKEFKPSTKPTATEKPVKQTSRPSQPNARDRRRNTANRSRTVTRRRSATADAGDFARLLHGSIVDLEKLAEPIDNTGDRYVAPLKYLAVWGSQKVNINTAPRHVLEAAFAFGGSPAEVTEAVIQERKQQPFKDIEDFETRMYGFSDIIRRTKPFITTQSKFFSIKVTAERGNARTVSVATVVKDDKKVSTVAQYSY